MTAAMHPDPRAALKDFDGRGREADVDGLVNEPMRHRVEMALDVDVVVDVHARLAPFGVDEALGRQRPQRRLIEAREEIAAGGPAVALHRPGVEIREQLADPGVQRGEREEGLMAQPREDPALGDLDGHFDFGFVARFRRSRRQNRRRVVRRPLFVRPLEDRFVAARRRGRRSCS